MRTCDPQHMTERAPVSLVLMADYLADPLWSGGPHGVTGMVSLDRLPLSAELRTSLRAWAARYDALMSSGYQWTSDAERLAWTADGRALLAPLINELGPGFNVSYREISA